MEENIGDKGAKNLKIRFKEWVEPVRRVRGDLESRYKYYRLDKNERVTHFSEHFWQSVIKKISQEHILAYPESERFYYKLAQHLNCQIDNLVLTAGSDAAIRNAFDLCVRPGDSVVTLSPTFAMVGVYCELFQAKNVAIEYDEKLNLDSQKLIHSINNSVALIIIANPNSPTGTIIQKETLLKIIRRAKEMGIIILIDEAYYGFCRETCLPYVNEFENLMVTRTFSKTCGLAGLRIGYIVAHHYLASLLYKFRPMYEVNGISLHFAEEILKHWDEVEAYIIDVQRGRDALKEGLAALKYPYIDTYTNFIHIDFCNRKDKILKQLHQDKFLVRGGLPIKGFENYLRITLGSQDVMSKFISSLGEK